jgi:hypothetical protein
LDEGHIEGEDVCAGCEHRATGRGVLREFWIRDDALDGKLPPDEVR